MEMSTPYVRLRSISYDDSVHDGQIQLILGPMFSGKTTELIRRIKRYSIANYRCLKIKYSHDTRYDENSIATHDKQKIEAVSAERLAEVKKIAATNEVIGIDEGQFFPDIVSFCEDMANLGKIVIVAALDGTYQKKGFGDILNLIPLAESVVKLTAVCMLCFKDASFTQRKSIETEIEVIGGADKYLAVCRTCFIAPSTSSEKNGTVLSKNRIPLGELNPADLME